MVSGTWFNNKSQFNLFQGQLDRARLQAKLAASKRMEAETAKLNEKYDGKAAAALQQKAEKLGDERMAVFDYNNRVEAALKRFNDARVSMLTAKDAIAAGSATAFDLAINSHNAWVSNKTTFPDSLIANTGNGFGRWKETEYAVSGGGLDTTVKEAFLGNDYAILVDGTDVSLRPDKDGGDLIGGPNGSVAMSNWDVVSLSGDQITVQDNANGATYTGTLKRGGLGVLNAWGYDDLATDEGKARATADLKAAMKELDKIELEFRNSQSGLDSILKRMDGQIKGLSDEYNKIANEEVDAKQAERRAIKTRFDIQTNALAITTGTATNFIYQLFQNPLTQPKKDLTDIMLASVKGG